MDAQTLQYEFPYSQFSFSTDIASIVLAAGRKSTFFQVFQLSFTGLAECQQPLQTDVNIPLRPVNTEAQSALYKSANEIVLPSAEQLEMYRSLFGGAKIGTVSINEQTREVPFLNRPTFIG